MGGVAPLLMPGLIDHDQARAREYNLLWPARYPPTQFLLAN